jgi:DNA replication ATP-dependent helicase Dna2
VKNPEARDGGLDVSLFKLLSEAHPDAVVNLEHQYRMCEEIMTLSNELIYSGRLKCGTPEVAKRVLKIPDESGLQKFHQGTSCKTPCWMTDLFSESVKACFVDTDAVPATEEKKGDRTINTIEAELTCQVAKTVQVIVIDC